MPPALSRLGGKEGKGVFSNVPVSRLRLSSRAERALVRNRIHSVGGVLEAVRNGFLFCHGIGTVIGTEIEIALNNYVGTQLFTDDEPALEHETGFEALLDSLPEDVGASLLESGIVCWQDVIDAVDASFAGVRNLDAREEDLIKSKVSLILAQCFGNAPELPHENLSQAYPRLYACLIDYGVEITGSVRAVLSLPSEIASILPSDCQDAVHEIQQRLLEDTTESSAPAEMGTSPYKVDTSIVDSMLDLSIEDLPISRTVLRKIEGADLTPRKALMVSRHQDRLPGAPTTEAIVSNAIRWVVLASEDTPGDIQTYTDPAFAPLINQHREASCATEVLASLASLVAQSERDCDIWMARFGLDGSGKHVTLDNMAMKYGVTRERVRQVEIHMSEAVKTALSATHLPHAGGLVVPPFLVNALEEMRARLSQIGVVVEPDVAAKALGLPLGKRGSYSTAMVMDFFGYWRLEYDSYSKTPWDSPWIWVCGEVEDREQLKSAVATVSRALRGNPRPISEEKLLSLVSSTTGAGAGVAKLAIDISPIALPTQGLAYEASFASLRTLADKAYRVLFRLGTTARIAHIAAEIARLSGLEEHEIRQRSVASQMSGDPRFVCVGRKGIWGLVDWDIEDRSIIQIAHDIIAEESCAVPIEELADLILEARPDVKRSSIYYCIENSDSLIACDGEIGIAEQASKAAEASSYLTANDLNRAFCTAIGPTGAGVDLDLRPVRLTIEGLALRVAAFVYQASGPNRQGGKAYYKLQLILPGQRRGDLGDYELNPGEFPLVIAFVPDRDVFVLWDANLHSGERYAFALTVKEDDVLQALGGEIVVSRRKSKGRVEQVISVHRSSLVKGIGKRWELTLKTCAEGYEP